MENKNSKICPTFEESYPFILNEVQKRRFRWTLHSLSWISWEDISSIIITHIWKKWSQYSCDKPLAPWLSMIISNQIKNLIRNHYGIFARPCLKCDAAVGETGCKIYKTQGGSVKFGKICAACPLYLDWEKKKKPAQNIKLAVSIENHPNETDNLTSESPDLSDQIGKVHAKMKEILKPNEYKVYEGLFILEEDEWVVAKKLGYIANEKDRTGRYKQIQNIRKIIIIKLRKAMDEGMIDIY